MSHRRTRHHQRVTKPAKRLPLEQLEHWLASTHAKVCAHRHGRPQVGIPPLVQSAARHFGVDRRTVQRGLQRLERRRQLLNTLLPTTPATAAMLLMSTRSFSHQDNATLTTAQMRHLAQGGTTSAQPQRVIERLPSTEALIAAITCLLDEGVLSVKHMQEIVIHADHPSPRTAGDQLAAIGLRSVTSGRPQPSHGPPSTPDEAVHTVLLEALDAYESTSTSVSPDVRSLFTQLRTRLARPTG